MPQSTAQRAQTTQDNQSSHNTVQKPVDKFREGPVHVSIWENDSVKGLFRAASFELRYKDSHEQWQTGHSYTVGALKYLETAAREARNRIEAWQQAQVKPEPTR